MASINKTYANLSLYDYYWFENVSEAEDSSECWPSNLQLLWQNGKLEIPLYSAIFLLAVVGNILVILTLARNRRMRTNTNVFLMSLAVSDLVLAVLCMPFTLIGSLLRDFVFGEWMCKLVPFLQATSVGTSVWTLVALSIERYYAICHPLRSRRWQTLSHAYHLICIIWVSCAICMLPIPVLSELQPTNRGHHKCRERWPNGDYERLYNVFLDFLLLVVPLLSLALTYYIIAVTLWRDMANKPGLGSDEGRGSVQNDTSPRIRTSSDENGSFEGENYDEMLHMRQVCRRNTRSRWGCPCRAEKCDSETGEVSTVSGALKLVRNTSSDGALLKIPQTHASLGLRHTNLERSLTNKQRVIKMLFVVVLEFFICWTPLYVINTLALFWPQLTYETLGYRTINFCQLLAYTSSCCNPITYCFMSRSFRVSFIHLFSCCRKQ